MFGGLTQVDSSFFFFNLIFFLFCPLTLSYFIIDLCNFIIPSLTSIMLSYSHDLSIRVWYAYKVC
jgi:hypothetical protein